MTMLGTTLGRRFDLGLLLRLLEMLAAIAAFGWALARPGLYATPLLAGLITAAAGIELWRFIRRTNFDVARFVEAVRHGDLTASFGGSDGGSGVGAFGSSGFAALGESLNAAIAQLRQMRAETQDENRYLLALIDDVTSPLISVGPGDAVQMLNKAARRLLGSGGALRLADLALHGKRFAVDVTAVRAGERLTTEISIGGAPAAAIISAAEIRHPRDGLMRIIAVQPIQRELDRAELAAQTDLVRVLTHEIMNSLTPVTSLSATAASLIAAADTGTDPAIGDARAAIETVARRAEGIMHFVRTYRQLTRPPELRLRRLEVLPLFTELKRLFESDWPPARVMLTIIAPAGLSIEADPDLLAQLLINLLRNAAEAAAARTAEAATSHAVEAACVELIASAEPGARTVLDVIDNGAGVPETLRQDIFLPFFSTKAEGTGVGLSLARQIALAHGGTLTCEPVLPHGTRFRLWL